jgi:hypothetical protein
MKASSIKRQTSGKHQTSSFNRRLAGLDACGFSEVWSLVFEIQE